MNASFPYLSASIWLPIVAGLIILAIGSDRNARLVRWLSLAAALAGFLVTLPLYTGFNAHSAGMQFQELSPWVERFSINYHLGIDGISVWLVLLTAFITVVVVVAGWEVIEERVAGYMAS
ncbi:MAG: putative NADH-ubiquinone oxidoreductase, chain, partial [Pseudomonadota bacterium]